MFWMNFTASFLATLSLLFATMPNLAITASYEAPLRGEPDDIVPGNYAVYLFPNYSLEQHSRTIKTDIALHIMNIFDTLYYDRVVYSAQDVDDSLLAAIRSDPGVEAVEYDYNVYAD
jgi:hypothetical protein